MWSLRYRVSRTEREENQVDIRKKVTSFRNFVFLFFRKNCSLWPTGLLLNLNTYFELVDKDRALVEQLSQTSYNWDATRICLDFLVQ